MVPDGSPEYLRGDRGIIMGRARQDLTKTETGIQTPDRGEAIISTIGILFPVGTGIHRYEVSIAGHSSGF